MSKRRKIMIALCVLTVGVLVICVLVIGALGYILFSRKGGDTEMVFAPTEVGTPEGGALAKERISLIQEGGAWKIESVSSGRLVEFNQLDVYTFRPFLNHSMVRSPSGQPRRA